MKSLSLHSFDQCVNQRLIKTNGNDFRHENWRQMLISLGKYYKNI